MAIRGREVTYTSIPQYIISNSLDGVGNKSFNKVCVNNKNCPYCLIYMTSYHQENGEKNNAKAIKVKIKRARQLDD